MWRYPCASKTEPSVNILDTWDCAEADGAMEVGKVQGCTASKAHADGLPREVVRGLEVGGS